jgi:hypothetical protein
MKTKTILIILALFTIAIQPAFSQKKIAITDMAQILTPETEAALQLRLTTDSLELTNLVDIRRSCDYWFANLTSETEGVQLTLKDCANKIAGTKNLGRLMTSASDNDKAMLLYYALVEIIRDPYKNVAQQTSLAPQEGTSGGAPVEEPSTDPGEHKSRYFFAPSALNLEKGELYYNSLYFLVHDIQYGVEKNFSIGMGTTVAMFPFYLTPKVTFPINSKTAFALGDMLMLGTWGTRFTGNLFYGTITRGDIYNNVSFGGGYLFLNEGEVSGKTNSAVFNFSALGKLSSHIYFITENYGSRVNGIGYASYYNDVTNIYLSEEFDQKIFFIYGSTGFRFINKIKDVISWQVGLSYIYTSEGEVPYKYTSPGWTVSAAGTGRLIAFPVIGFSKKFGTKY